MVNNRKLMKCYMIMKVEGLEAPARIEVKSVIKAIQKEFKFSQDQVPEECEEDFVDQFLEKYAEGDLEEYLLCRKSRVDFYASPEWKKLRQVAFEVFGHHCQKCGSEENLQVDHVRSRAAFPELEMCLSNLGILCKECNRLKSGSTDEYRSSMDIVNAGRIEIGLPKLIP